MTMLPPGGLESENADSVDPSILLAFMVVTNCEQFDCWNKSPTLIELVILG